MIYRVKKPFKSVGILYMIGQEISEQDFMNPNKLRLGKIKVSEGFLVPISEENHIIDSPLPKCGDSNGVVKKANSRVKKTVTTPSE